MALWLRSSLLDEDCDRRLWVKQARKRFISLGFNLRESRKSIGASFGKSAHAIFHKQLQYKAETGKKPHPLFGFDEELKLLEAECKSGMKFDTSATKDRYQAAEQLEAVVREFNGSYLPYNSTYQTEKELSIWWDDERTVLFTTTPDHVTMAGSVDDGKTGVREPIQPLQAGGQGLALIEHGFTPKQFRTLWFPRTNPELKEIIYPMVVMKEAEARIEQLIRDWKLFEKERSPLVFRANPQSKSCGAQYCTAYGTNACPLKQGEVTGDERINKD